MHLIFKIILLNCHKFSYLFLYMFVCMYVCVHIKGWTYVYSMHVPVFTHIWRTETSGVLPQEYHLSYFMIGFHVGLGLASQAALSG